MNDADPLILTVRPDERTLHIMQKLRDEHFPPERNIVPAHVSLFHNLPGAERTTIMADLAAAAAACAAIPLEATGMRFLGAGCAIALEAPMLTAFRRSLAARWNLWLMPQDRQVLRFHATVQNKVPADLARATYTRLQSTFRPFDGWFTGIDCWRYRGGPWTHEAFFVLDTSVI